MRVKEITIFFSEDSPLFEGHNGNIQFEDVNVEGNDKFLSIVEEKEGEHDETIKEIPRSSIVMIEVDRDE